MASVCIFCGGDCGRVCRGLGFSKNKVHTAVTETLASREKVSGRTTNRELPAPRLNRESGGAAPTVQKAQALGSKRAEVQGSALIAEEGGKPSTLISKKGRPRLDEPYEKPWLKLGLTERTYYRRRAEQNKGEKK